MVLDNRKRFNALCCGRRWGKSVFAENLLIEPALAGFPVSYNAPTYKLLNEVYRTIVERCKEIILKKSDTEKRIELITGGVIDFWSFQNKDAGRGRKYKVQVTDESAFIPGLWDIWTQNIRPTLTDFKGEAWFLSTPKGKNDFYKICNKGMTGEENWAFFHQTTYDNPYIDPSEVDDARKDLPELAFSQEYLAEFNDNIANPFGIEYIKQCTYPMSVAPAVCYGIDLAKSFDYTVIIGLDANCSVCHFERFQHDWRTTTQKIKSLPNVPIAIDSTGVGDPIGEDVARVKDVELFHFTNRSKQQIMEGLAVKIQKREITFPEGIITQELSDFEYQYTAGGVKYAAPDGLHDDTVCALALAVNKWRGRGTGKYAFI